VSATLAVRSPRPAVLDDVPLRVDRDEVLRFQGYKKDVDVPDATVLALFEEALGLGESLIEPRVVYRTVKVTGQGPDLIEAGGQSLHIPEIARRWGALEECQAAIPAGVKVTNRISPGYAGWDTAEQSALFALCAGEPIGVTLNASCVMTPAKSISFLVGVGPAVRVDHYFTQCRRCWMRECAYRRAPALVTVRR